MASSIGWIDFSPKDRSRVKKFLELVGQEGVRDELGIGAIRDAFSNHLYPGFSTLYTRAKYFLITPYIVADWMSKYKDKQTGLEYFQKREIEINNAIHEKYRNSPEISYFGKEKIDGKLKRQPSEIYWNGIIYYHLINTDTSLSQLLINKDSSYDELLSQNTGDDITHEDGGLRQKDVVNVTYDPDWFTFIKTNGLILSSQEADLLKDRIIKYAPDSLTAALLADKNLWKIYMKHENCPFSDTHNPFVSFAEEVIENKLITNIDLINHIRLAHDFALFIHGAHIAYNISIRQKANGTEEDNYINKLKDKGELWMTNLKEKLFDNDLNNLYSFLNGLRLNKFTQRFLQDLRILITPEKNWPEIEADLCRLVEKQERDNKRSKSRFAKLEKGLVVDGLAASRWIGLGLINFRYRAVLTVLKDINETK